MWPGNDPIRRHLREWPPNSSQPCDFAVPKAQTMQSIWQSLAWKEWHEHKWKLSAILVVIWGMAAFMAIMNNRERYGIAESFLVGLFLGGIPMAMFVGLGIAAGERSRGTLPFLQ